MFSPKLEKSQRVMLLERFEDVPYGETVTYDELGEVLGGFDVKQVQSAVNGAKRSLEVHHRRTLEAVPTVGYRVVDPREHTRLAEHQQSKSKRALVRAKSTVSHVNLSSLTEGERAAVSIATMALAAQLDFARRADLRYASKARVEEFMDKHDEKSTRTAEELEAVRERMARLEARLAATKDCK